MKDVSRREFLKTLCLGITVAALQNLPMTTAFADSAISKTKIISKSDRENLVATVARTVQVSYKIDKNTIIDWTAILANCIGGCFRRRWMPLP